MGLPASNIMSGECFGIPDVCNTPTPAGPVPIPYPNMALLEQTILPTAALTVMISGANAVLETTEVMMTDGDDGGTVGGVMSGTFIGPAQIRLGSVTVMIEGRGAAYLGSLVGQNNSANSNVPVGTQVAPSQVTVLVGP